MSGTITLDINDTGTYTISELKEKIQMYVAHITKNSSKNKKYFGCINLDKDPMEIQKEMRNEW